MKAVTNTTSFSGHAVASIVAAALLGMLPGPLEAIDLCGDTGTPVAISFDQRGFLFTDIDNGVWFDIDADGDTDRIAWLSPSFDLAWLALDRNSNGVIDNGAELFGDATPQPSSRLPNGFQALKVFDAPEAGGNGDGFITVADAVFAELQLWRDRNSDGISQLDELEHLGNTSIEAIALEPVESSRRDRFGNQLRWAAMVYFEESRRLAAADVILLQE